MKEQLLQLDNIRLNFGENGSIILNIVLAFVMFGVALGIKPLHFKTAFQNPKAVITGMTTQLVLLPMCTFILLYIFREYLSLSVALGAILVACCPGGNISNFLSSLSKGNIELSVSLTAISTVLSVVVTPLNFTFWSNLYAQSTIIGNQIEMPISEVFTTLLFMLGIPLIIGIIFSQKLKTLSCKIQKPMQNISVIIFLIIVVIAFCQNFEYFVKYIKYILILVFIHNLLALSIGFFAAKIMKLNQKDQKTLTIETGIQNSGLALILLCNPSIFPEDFKIGGMLFMCAWWGVWHIISGFCVVMIWQKSRQMRYKKLIEEKK